MLTAHEASLMARYKSNANGSTYARMIGAEGVGQLHGIFISMPELLPTFIASKPRMTFKSDDVTVTFAIPLRWQPKLGEKYTRISRDLTFSFDIPLGPQPERKAKEASRPLPAMPTMSSPQPQGHAQVVLQPQDELTMLWDRFLLFEARVSSKVMGSMGVLAEAALSKIAMYDEPRLSEQLPRMLQLMGDLPLGPHNIDVKAVLTKLDTRAYEILVEHGLSVNTLIDNVHSFFVLLSKTMITLASEEYVERAFERAAFMVDHFIDFNVRSPQNRTILGHLYNLGISAKLEMQPHSKAAIKVNMLSNKLYEYIERIEPL
jgi:hypothetical protein